MNVWKQNTFPYLRCSTHCYVKVRTHFTRESVVARFEPLLITGFPLFIQAFHDTQILDWMPKIIYVLRKDFLLLQTYSQKLST